MQRKTILRWWFGISILLACLLWAITDSQSFRDCIKERKNHEPYQELHKEGTLFVKSIGLRMELHSACGIISANENTGAVTGIAGVIVAIFTGTLWWVTWGMVKIAKEQRLDTLKVIKAADDSAKAAIKNAHAAKRTADSLINLERPWMVGTVSESGVTEAIIAIGTDEIGEIDITLSFRNEGRTPAFIGIFHLETAIVHYEIPTRYDEIKPYTKPANYSRRDPGIETRALNIDNESRAIGPGGHICFQIADTVGISRSSADRILAGDSAIWFHGRLEYSDFFREDRATHFCFICAGREAVMQWGGRKENYMT